MTAMKSIINQATEAWTEENPIVINGVTFNLKKKGNPEDGSVILYPSGDPHEKGTTGYDACKVTGKDITYAY